MKFLLPLILLLSFLASCTTSQERFAACKALLDYGFSNYALVNPQLSEPASVPVKLGVADTVQAVLPEQIPMLVEKGQKNLITTQVTLDESVDAPVSKGQRLGTMTVYAGEQVLQQIPLVAESSVEKLTWGQVFMKLLKYLAMADE